MYIETGNTYKSIRNVALKNTKQRKPKSPLPTNNKTPPLRIHRIEIWGLSIHRVGPSFVKGVAQYQFKQEHNLYSHLGYNVKKYLPSYFLDGRAIF